MNVNYLMISYNRRDGLLRNLAAVYANRPDAYIWVVDNASTDGTVDAVRSQFPRVRIIQSDRNLGMPARNLALRQMKSEFAVLLDDDSHPLDDAIERSVRHMQRHPDVAAVVGRVELPGGAVEAPAMPAVLLGGASCVRLSALREVGFFPHDFFRQAEEYDLSCRLWDAGWRVDRFEDVRYLHEKVQAPGRASSVVTALDLKHNLILAERYLPDPYRQAYRDDFAQRYGAIMRHAGHASEYESTLRDADAYVANPRLLRRQCLGPDAFEAIFGHRHQLGQISTWIARHGARRIAIADFSKNLFATHQACGRLSIDVLAIIDDRAAFAGEIYRRVSVKPAESVDPQSIDGVVISNTNPAQVEAIATRLRSHFRVPVLALWTPRTLTDAKTRSLAA